MGRHTCTSRDVISRRESMRFPGVFSCQRPLHMLYWEKPQNMGETDLKDFFCRLVTPWRAQALFDEDEAFFQFLSRYNRRCNTVRAVLFAAAAIMLIIGYAAASTQPYYSICVALLVVALGLSLIIAQNEKLLPEDMRQK